MWSLPLMCWWCALALSPAPPAPRVPVLAELYTSEGCSSCPPADALLARLSEDQPIAGAEVVALELHVDYWDRLGWKDPFSSPVATERQSWYARAFGTASLYTPQLIVDGTSEIVGSDAGEARRAIGRAARATKVPVHVRVSSSGATAGSLEIAVRVDDASAAPASEPVDVLVSITEDGLTSDIQRGENRGRTLPHTAVVRRIEVVGSLAGRGGTFQKTLSWPIAAGWNRAKLKVTAFLQGRESRRVYGVGFAPLP